MSSCREQPETAVYTCLNVSFDGCDSGHLVCVCVFAHVCLYLCVFAHMCVCIAVCVHMCVCVCMSVCACMLAIKIQ